MPGKSLEQRMTDTETRIRQLEVQRRLLTQQLRTQQRKERTRQLIQIGGIMVRLGFDTVEKVQALQQVLEAQPEILARSLHVVGLVTHGRPSASPQGE